MMCTVCRVSWHAIISKPPGARMVGIVVCGLLLCIVNQSGGPCAQGYSQCRGPRRHECGLYPGQYLPSLRKHRTQWTPRTGISHPAESFAVARRFACICTDWLATCKRNGALKCGTTNLVCRTTLNVPPADGHSGLQFAGREQPD
jgi:hypothetical protein